MRDLEGVRRLRYAFLTDGEKRPGRAVDDRVSKRDVRGRIACDSGEPAIAEAHLGELDKGGFPKQQAIQPEVDVRRGAIFFAALGPVQLLPDLIDKIVRG